MDLNDAERHVARAVVEYAPDGDAVVSREALRQFDAEYDRRGAALADAQAEVARLRAARERALVLADDLDKEAGEDSPTDTPRVTDPASRGYLAGVANAYGEAARRLRLSLAITAATVNSELGVAALAVAPAPAEDEPPRPVDCTVCGTGYEECTAALHDRLAVCCPSCRATDTHRAIPWEKAQRAAPAPAREQADPADEDGEHR